MKRVYIFIFTALAISATILRDKYKKIKIIQKIMKRNSLKVRLRSTPFLVIISILTIISAFVIVPIVRADSYQAQINALSAQNSQLQSSADQLHNQASSYQAEVVQVQSQIAGLQNSINVNQNKSSQIQLEIQQENAQVAQDKLVLGNDIKTMYVNGQLNTVEMLATSSNLSQYVDQQVAYESVQHKIQNTLAQISAMENSLTQQKAQLSVVIKSQELQNSQLLNSENQLQQLLSYNQQQQASYNQQIQSNQSKIATLTAEQIAANRKLVNSSGGRVITSGSCGGSYPASASGPFGNWGCDYPLDNTLDNWGMYNRECVSYTAWMVYKTYGFMPYWGGSGDANQWPADAAAAGIPTGTTPKVGSVAIYMGGAGDPWGHAMWVVGINGNKIIVDQYNLYYDGNFYQTEISSSGLIYIYF
jgi:peptidoglycan hydrolase CwlO-like protein/surface antigen